LASNAEDNGGYAVSFRNRTESGVYLSASNAEDKDGYAISGIKSRHKIALKIFKNNQNNRFCYLTIKITDSGSEISLGLKVEG